MGKSRNHADYEEAYYENRPVQKKKWYEDEVIVQQHRLEKYKNVDVPLDTKMPYEYWD